MENVLGSTVISYSTFCLDLAMCVICGSNSSFCLKTYMHGSFMKKRTHHIFRDINIGYSAFDMKYFGIQAILYSPRMHIRPRLTTRACARRMVPTKSLK